MVHWRRRTGWRSSPVVVYAPRAGVDPTVLLLAAAAVLVLALRR